MSACENGPQYGYGKRFYDNVAHDVEKIYPLKSELKYNSNPDNEIKKDKINIIQASITGNVADSHVMVTISLVNNTKSPLAISKKLFPYKGKIADQIFSIQTECIRLDYLGPYVNFGMEYTYPDDFIIIKPGAMFNDTVFLDEYYHFLPGEHQYQIRMLDTPATFKSKSTHKEKEIIINSTPIFITVNSEKINKNIKSGY
ncbi:hypothetical protein GM30_14560 [Trabulsiella odontotermitis]|nr:hypothetical protein GM30_14560 [Trabulsiella odontotermitis]